MGRMISFRNLLLGLAVGGVCVSPLFAEKKFQMDVDYASFRYDDRAAFVEVYYGIQQSDVARLKEKAEGEDWVIRMQLRVLRNDTLWVENEWESRSALDTSVGLERGARIAGRVYFLAPEGEYAVRLTAVDTEMAGCRDSVDFEMDVDPYTADRLRMSDIELATSIQFNAKEDWENPFYKNSLVVVPHPSLVFGVSQPVLYYYAEMYNLLAHVPQKTYRVRTTVVDGSGNRVEEVQPVVRMKKRTMDSVVEVGEVGLFALPGGSYFLELAVEDSTGQELLSKSKKFFIYNPDKVRREEAQTIAPEALFSISPFAHMEKERLEQELEYTTYLMAPAQKKLSKSLETDDAKRRFLFQFWRELDETPSTPESEFYSEYKRRIIYANMNFSSMRSEGWQTDRGRVYMVYGPPTDIERNASTAGTAPFNVWTYDQIEGGVVFVFADLRGFKEYILLHSTKQGEVYNPNYEEMLTRGF